MMSADGLINLPHWDSGGRKIRYLYMGDNNDFHFTTTSTNEQQLIPLFLGADLYSDTCIRVGNHPRYHAKFAKKGLATKLVFSPEHRFQGLRLPCGKNSMWFYNVQGVFRVAFELYSKLEQLRVLDTFKDLLKSRLNDDPLKTTYELTKRCGNPQPLCESHTTTSPCTSIDGSTSDAVACNPLNEQACEPPHLEQINEETSEDHDYCSPVKSNCMSDQISQTLQHLESQLQLIAITESEQRQIISSCLRLIERCADDCRTFDEEQLARVVTSLLHLQSPSSLDIYRSPLLQAVAGWLGQCFHAANGCISQRVEAFKVQHIERISDLPPAEELAAELFPEAMRTLLVHWMGLGQEAALWKRHSEFPILLLILEFANHNLITGVAHVLYSSLISK